jgi:hydrogenase expression/formation protein HypE
MMGAVPEYLSLALIIEEGLDYKILEKIVFSIQSQAKRSRVRFVTGDTKVVERGACDKLFINTCGIGRLIKNRNISLKNIAAHDKIIITGRIAEHGLAVLAKRKELGAGFNIKSDCAALADLIIPVLKRTKAIKFMRDPTRGGLATTLNEIAAGSGLGIITHEAKIPISEKVRAAAELLGIDPLYVANEGKAILVVSKTGGAEVLSLLRRHPLGKYAQIIGEVQKSLPGKAVLQTVLGTQRIIDMLDAEPLPRIC